MTNLAGIDLKEFIDGQMCPRKEFIMANWKDVEVMVLADEPIRGDIREAVDRAGWFCYSVEDSLVGLTVHMSSPRMPDEDVRSLSEAFPEACFVMKFRISMFGEGWMIFAGGEVIADSFFDHSEDWMDSVMRDV